MWYRIKENKIYLTLNVRPNAKENAFLGIHDDALRVSIKAKPENGKANRMLIAFLSESFKIPKSEIALAQGAHTRKKQVSLPINETLRNFLRMEEGLFSQI